MIDETPLNAVSSPASTHQFGFHLLESPNCIRYWQGNDAIVMIRVHLAGRKLEAWLADCSACSDGVADVGRRSSSRSSRNQQESADLPDHPGFGPLCPPIKTLFHGSHGLDFCC